MSDLKALMQLSEQEEALLVLHNDGLQDLVPAIVQEVYAFITSFPELGRLLADEETQLKHRKALGYYINSLTSGRYDAEYIAQREHIGEVHFRLGVKPEWYLAAYRVLITSFAAHLGKCTGDNRRLHQQILGAVIKVAFFDMQLALNNYLDASTRTLESKKLLAEGALRIFASTSSVVGDEFFVALARSMMSELGMSHIYIIELPEGLDGPVNLLGVSTPDAPPLPPSGTEWPLVEQCLADGVTAIVQPRNIQILLPSSAWLRDANAEAVGVSLLRDASGTLIGLIAVADDKPLDDEHRVNTLLPLFSARAAMEIQRIRFEDHLAHQSSHDALTGLPNRVLLNDRLNHELLVAERAGLSVAVLFIDLDDFKDVNDCFGHETGDQLLMHVAASLHETLRDEDTVARYGGDEFVVVLGRLESAADAELVAQKIVAAVAQPIEINGQLIHGKASIGIAAYPEDGKDAHTLLRNADTALYRTKESHNLQYQFFTSAMNAELVRRVALEDQLRHACKRGELALHYQPQVDLAHGCIIGVEALLRWNHPNRGAVPPSEFIPVAESSGLIVEIGNWVIERACRDLRTWRLQGNKELRLSVNVSSRQFENESIFASVIERLGRYEIPYDVFEIELTESLLIENPAATRKLLHAFHEKGILISMDDFGTGYSSLSYLKQYPIGRLKIDRSFVRDIAHDANDAALVQAIIAMAQALDIEVIAEGVETELQCHRLAGWGCPVAQGYYLGRPVMAERISQMLAAKGLTDRINTAFS